MSPGGSKSAALKDPIDDAIKATDAQAVELAQLTVTISSTGRQWVIAFPPDSTDSELLEFIGWAATGLRNGLTAERQKRAMGGLVIAKSLPPG